MLETRLASLEHEVVLLRRKSLMYRNIFMVSIALFTSSLLVSWFADDPAEIRAKKFTLLNENGQKAGEWANYGGDVGLMMSAKSNDPTNGEIVSTISIKANAHTTPGTFIDCSMENAGKASSAFLNCSKDDVTLSTIRRDALQKGVMEATLVTSLDNSKFYYMKNRTSRMKLGFNNETGQPALEINDSNGNQRAVLGSIAVKGRIGGIEMYPESSLWLIDESGKGVFNAPQSK
jgi:hypothetical protein